ADEELRHVVVPELVEVIGPDHHEDVGVGLGEGLAVGQDLAHPFVRKVGSALWRRGAGAVEERMVRCREDGNQGGHEFLLRAWPAPRAGAQRTWSMGSVVVSYLHLPPQLPPSLTPRRRSEGPAGRSRCDLPRSRWRARWACASPRRSVRAAPLCAR